MVIGRAARQALRRPAIQKLFSQEQVETVLAVFELTEYAWHDCYNESSPPRRVISDILVCSRGDLATLIQAARMAVQDHRDLSMWAEDVRKQA